jgi:hypothetical protein
MEFRYLHYYFFFVKVPEFLLVDGFLNEGLEPSFFLFNSEETELVLVLDLLLKLPVRSEVVGAFESVLLVEDFVL